ncbi:hypothetical protein [uncultured Roseibium sp.]|uniref:hypothetical protein n=1 Tax=uncultured Roseibium sp. TaxID=1936171 RepID=UPI002613AEE9|nr:hypothetical protein [uncultured Roseibium sp.]
MNLHAAHCLLVRDGLTYNRPRLSWLPRKLYRSFGDANKSIRRLNWAKADKSNTDASAR